MITTDINYYYYYLMNALERSAREISIEIVLQMKYAVFQGLDNLLFTRQGACAAREVTLSEEPVT